MKPGNFVVFRRELYRIAALGDVPGTFDLAPEPDIKRDRWRNVPRSELDYAVMLQADDESNGSVRTPSHTAGPDIETRSERLRNAGFTRRPTGKSVGGLMREDDGESGGEAN